MVPSAASRRAIVTTITVSVIALTVLHLAAVLVEHAMGADYFQRRHLEEIRRQFDLEQEANFTTWYASATLLLCAFLLQTIAQRVRADGGRFAVQWTLLAAAFLYLSIDETAMFHEATIKPLRNVLNPSGIFYYSWVALALPVLLLLIVTELKLVVSLPKRTRVGFLLAGAVYVGGALVMEMVEGVIAIRIGEGTLSMRMAQSLEEIMEMLGVLLFVRALLGYMSEYRPMGALDQPHRST